MLHFPEKRRQVSFVHKPEMHFRFGSATELRQINPVWNWNLDVVRGQNRKTAPGYRPGA